MYRSRAPRTRPAVRVALALLLGSASLLMFAKAGANGAGAQSSSPPSATSSPSALAALGGPPNSEPNAPSKSPLGPGAGEAGAPVPSSPALIASGKALFRDSCSSCHGANLEGHRGVAPSLRGVGAGATDFYLSTGRMPLPNPRLEPLRAPPHFSAAQIKALDAYVGSFGGPPPPIVDPAKGSLAVGEHAFTLNCAGCHQIVARGGLTLGALVPDLQSASARQVAEAIRTGPYLMPHFGPRQIDQHELDSIARYVLWTRHPSDNGGWGIYNIGPIPEGIVAWFLLLATVVLVARLIGERTA